MECVTFTPLAIFLEFDFALNLFPVLPAPVVYALTFRAR